MIEYEVIEGELAQDQMERICELERQCFDNEYYNRESLLYELAEKRNLLTLFAQINGEDVGFKVGYERRKGKFESWLGGVLPHARGKGVASGLMELQHKLLRAKQYKLVRTLTGNEFRPMLLLNIKSGFDVMGTYLNSQGDIRIILEKKL